MTDANERAGEVLVASAIEAGEIIRKSFRTAEVEVQDQRSRANLVTNIDLAVQETLFRTVAADLPGIPILGEEGEHREIPEEAIIVDPLDGTLNFVHGYDRVAVSLGYWKGDRPVAGVVYNPVSGDLFRSISGMGAFWNDTAIRPSRRERLEQCLLATGWPYDRDEHERAFRVLARFSASCQEVRVTGSAALNICYVAAGVIDGYWEWGLRPWDLAGGAAIASEAGCELSRRTGAAFSVRGQEVLVSNPRVHAEMVAVLNNRE